LKSRIIVYVKRKSKTFDEQKVEKDDHGRETKARLKKKRYAHVT
jgi:hypothetical protein